MGHSLVVLETGKTSGNLSKKPTYLFIQKPCPKTSVGHVNGLKIGMTKIARELDNFVALA